MFLGLLSGLLLRVAGPEWPLAPLAVLGIATWAAAVRGQRSHWNAMACTVIFVLLGIASRLNWLFPMDHGDSVPGVYRLGWIILSALFVTTLALLSISMRGLARRDWPMVVVVPLTWMVWEAAVGWVLGRMMNLPLDPIRLATTQVTFPFCQLADLGGLTLVAGSVAAASGLLLDVIDEQAGRASRTLLTRLNASPRMRKWSA